MIENSLNITATVRKSLRLHRKGNLLIIRQTTRTIFYSIWYSSLKQPWSNSFAISFSFIFMQDRKNRVEIFVPRAADQRTEERNDRKFFERRRHRQKKSSASSKGKTWFVNELDQSNAFDTRQILARLCKVERYSVAPLKRTPFIGPGSFIRANLMEYDSLGKLRKVAD